MITRYKRGKYTIVRKIEKGFVNYVKQDEFMRGRFILNGMLGFVWI